MELKDVHKALEQAAIFKTVFDAFPHSIVIATPDGIIRFTNNAFQQLSGVDASCAISKSVDEFFQCSTTDEPPVSRLFREAGCQRIELANRFIRTGDKKIRVNLTVTDMDPVVCYTVIKAPKLTEVPARYDDLKNLYVALADKNEQLSQANEALLRSNKELSQYAYVASHDLQEPLRKIRIFGDLLATNNQLSGKDRFLANKINTASERMSFLIRDLLTYSKLLKTEVKYEKVDLGEILKAVFSDFEVSIQEKKAQISFGELPVITAVRLQMNQLFYNLLGNALKFTAPGESPKIEIESVAMDPDTAAREFPGYNPALSYIKLVFRDHGIGFESKQAENIFKVFQRLHTRDMYQGSGIGLALCRRIVQNHQGRLFAVSQPGHGASFHIILPVTHTSEQKKGPE